MGEWFLIGASLVYHVSTVSIYRQDEHGTMITAVHVDDYLSITSLRSANDRFHDQLLQKWKISESEADLYLGIAIQCEPSTGSIYISQTAMIDAVIADFCPPNSHVIATPMAEDTNKVLQ